jgi:hypothetical protein
LPAFDSISEIRLPTGMVILIRDLPKENPNTPHPLEISAGLNTPDTVLHSGVVELSAFTRV